MDGEANRRAIWEIETDNEKSLTIDAEDIEVVGNYAGVSATTAAIMIKKHYEKMDTYTPIYVIPKGEPSNDD